MQNNPFGYKDNFNSPEMKDLLKDLKNITAKICLLYTEENSKYDSNELRSIINSQVDFTECYFKTAAYHELSVLCADDKIDLAFADKIAVAAHKAYKKVTGD